jgi:hypothetical protein
MNCLYSFYFSDKPIDGSSYAYGFAIGNAISFTVAGLILGIILFLISFRPKFGGSDEENDKMVDIN